MPPDASLTSVLLLGVCALVVGTLIGCVGVGGVLLPPALVYVGGFDLHLALAVSVWCFFFTGVAGTWTYARRGSIAWGPMRWIALGIVPAALLGATTSSQLPGAALEVVIAALVLAVGLDTVLRRNPRGDRDPSSLSRRFLTLLGAGVGFGSAATGTGGPVLLVPALVVGGVRTLPAVGLGQVSQLPVAVFATTGFVLGGEYAPLAATLLGLVATLGTLAGARIAHAVPLGTLRTIVAVVCVGTGILMLSPVP